MLGLHVEVVKADGVKCPRCWKYTVVGQYNYDNLCDMCCHVILEDYPNLVEAVSGIQAAYATQRERWKV